MAVLLLPSDVQAGGNSRLALTGR